MDDLQPKLRYRKRTTIVAALALMMLVTWVATSKTYWHAPILRLPSGRFLLFWIGNSKYGMQIDEPYSLAPMTDPSTQVFSLVTDSTWGNPGLHYASRRHALIERIEGKPDRILDIGGRTREWYISQWFVLLPVLCWLAYCIMRLTRSWNAVAIARSNLCPTCRYDLRGHVDQPNARCPECGNTISGEVSVTTAIQRSFLKKRSNV